MQEDKKIAKKKAILLNLPMEVIIKLKEMQAEAFKRGGSTPSYTDICLPWIEAGLENANKLSNHIK